MGCRMTLQGYFQIIIYFSRIKREVSLLGAYLNRLTAYLLKTILMRDCVKAVFVELGQLSNWQCTSDLYNNPSRAQCPLACFGCICSKAGLSSSDLIEYYQEAYSSFHAQEICISRDVNKIHMAEVGGADLVQNPRSLLRIFYFSAKMTNIFPNFFIKRFQWIITSPKQQKKFFGTFLHKECL